MSLNQTSLSEDCYNYKNQYNGRNPLIHIGYKTINNMVKNLLFFDPSKKHIEDISERVINIGEHFTIFGYDAVVEQFYYGYWLE